MKKKIITALLISAMLVFPVSALTVTAGGNSAYAGEFTDISESDWYFNDVAEAYSRGLLSGKTDTTFAPEQNLTIAETIKLAASVHQLLATGKNDASAFVSASGNHWYDGYVSYAYKNGIVTEEYDDYNAPASRAQVAVLFSRAARSSGAVFEEINPAAFGDLPDVSNEMWYAGAVYNMYRWGIITGDASRSIKPESDIKRREIAAIIMRMIDSERRVKVGAEMESKNETAQEAALPEKNVSTEKEPESVQEVIPVSGSLKLYEGSRDAKAFTGITGMAAEFIVSDSVPAVSASYSLDLINNLVVEPDNISFRLYTGSGFEALGIVRGWLNEAARGKDGAAVNDKDSVFTLINETAYLWINGERKVISEMWYADHGDYTTYAFYFDEKINPSKISSVDFSVGRLDRSIFESASMTDLADAIEKADKEGVIVPESPADTASDNYKAAVSDAKESAAEIIFEYEAERCAVIYGRGLYGRESSEYRLLFVFKDGTTQTVASQKLDDIRMNSAGNVIYYNMTGPDGKILQYGINFGE